MTYDSAFNLFKPLADELTNDFLPSCKRLANG